MQFVHSDPAKDLPLHHRILHKHKPNNSKQINMEARSITINKGASSVDSEKEPITQLPPIDQVDGYNKTSKGNNTSILPKNPITSFSTTKYGIIRERTVAYDGKHIPIKLKARHQSKRRNTTATLSSRNANSAKVQDIRFSQLRKSLVPPYKPVDGYLQLSAGDNVYSTSHPDGILSRVGVTRGQTI